MNMSIDRCFMTRSRQKWLLLCLAWCLFCLAGCACGSDGTKRLGEKCTENSECSTQAECRAGRCRTPLPVVSPTAKIQVISLQGAVVGRRITLSGEGSFSPTGAPLRFIWKLKVPEGSHTLLQEDTSARPSLTPDIPGSYDITLVVRDDVATSEPVSLQLGIDASDQKPPVANAGADRTVATGITATLNGAKSYDPTGGSLFFQWSLRRRPTGSLATVFMAKPAAPTIIPDKPGEYVIGLVVRNESGVPSQEDTVTITAKDDLPVVPILLAISPSAMNFKPSFTMEITGEQFLPGAQVHVNGTPFPTTYDSENQLTAKISLPTSLQESSLPVVVVNPQNQRSGTLKLDVTSSPLVLGLSPSSGASGQILSLVVQGNYFRASSLVYFDGAPLKAESSFSPKTLRVKLSLASVTPGTYQVYVRTGSLTSKLFPFQVTAPSPRPTLQALFPATGVVGQQPSFYVSGDGFVEGSQIIFNGNPIPTKRLSRNRLSASPHLDLRNIPAGSYSIWVRLPSGLDSNKMNFVVEAVPPGVRLDRVLPFTLAIGEKTKLSFYGSRFAKGAEAYVNGVKLVVDPNQSSSTFLTATLDATKGQWTPGNYDAQVINPSGEKSNNFKISITYPTPVIDELTPNGWTSGCDVDVTIFGRFRPYTKIHFGTFVFEQQPANMTYKLNYVSSSEVRFRVPREDLLRSSVVTSVFAANYQERSLIENFTIGAQRLVQPMIGNINPSSVAAKVSTQVQLTPWLGTTFLPGTTLLLNGTPQPTSCLSYDQARQCRQLRATLDLTKAAPGMASVALRHPCGQTSASRRFYIFAASSNPAQLQYASPSSLVANGQLTTTGLFLYGANLCSAATSGQCSTTPSIEIIGPNQTDYSNRAKVILATKAYIRLNFDIRSLPLGAYLIRLVIPGGQKSNPVLFELVEQPVPVITGPVSLVRGVTRLVKLVGAGFLKGDVLIFNNQQLNPIPLNVNSPVDATASIDLSQIKYEGSYPLVIKRCHDTSCSKSTLSKSFSVRVENLSTCQPGACAAAMSPKQSEGCTSYKGGLTCRPKCKTTSDCQAMTGAPAFAVCDGGFCK